MKRKKRTSILIHCDEAQLKYWAENFEQGVTLQVIQPPQRALTMIKMRESAQNTLFYLCEMLVSETRVSCDGVIGIGLIQGDEPEKSEYLAVIDAACNAKHPYVSKFEEELQAVEIRLQEQKQQEIASILKTRVQFETMDV